MPDTVEQIYDALAAEHSGKLTVVGKAVARALAVALSSDVPDPSVVARLQSAMPEKPNAADAQYDLGELNDRELALLEYLHRKARGETVGEPPSIEPSWREVRATDLAEQLDAIDAKHGRFCFPSLSDSEQREIRDALSTLLGNLMRLEDIAAPQRVEVEFVPGNDDACPHCHRRPSQPVLPSAPAALPAPEEMRATDDAEADAPLSGEVLPPPERIERKRPSIHDGGDVPLKGAPEAWRGHVGAVGGPADVRAGNPGAGPYQRFDNLQRPRSGY